MMFRTLLTITCLAFVSSAYAADKGTTIWDGVYTKSQAARGSEAFSLYCAQCHGRGFAGKGFMDRWREDKLSSLYDFVHNNMPVGSPGSVSAADDVDIVAYLLSTNDVPAGEDELSLETMGFIQVQTKNGPEPVPDGALVQVIGCLVREGETGWQLTNATEPVRSRDSEKSPDSDVSKLAAKPLGTATFRLPDVSFYKPKDHVDHKVELKGFLDRNAKGDRILATSLMSVAPTCGK